jgi:uncharacterized membrane protein (DUF485 family)
VLSKKQIKIAGVKMSKLKSIDQKLFRRRMRITAILSALIFLFFFAMVYGVYYTLYNITNNIIASTVFIAIIIAIGCMCITMIYSQIPWDAYDSAYNMSTVEQKNKISVMVSVFNAYSKSRAIEEKKSEHEVLTINTGIESCE